MYIPYNSQKSEKDNNSKWEEGDECIGMYVWMPVLKYFSE